MSKPTEGVYVTQPGQSFRHLEAVTPSDSTEVNFEALYVGTIGDVVIVNGNNQQVTLVQASGWHFVQVSKVMAATGASDIVGAR